MNPNHPPGAQPLNAAPGTAFPKRFYRTAGIAREGDGFVLTLDGRPARTPARNPMILPTSALAKAVSDEWAAVESTVDPRAMPMTRLVNSVIDGVAQTDEAVFEDVLRYAGTDLLVYRATEPQDLVRAQQAAWDPILRWSRESLGADLTLATGVMFVAQPPRALDQLAETLKGLVGSGASAPFRLGAVHVMTTLTGSALLGFAVAAGRVDVEAAWSAAHVDEDFQIAQWGEDSEAVQRRDQRWVEMRTAAQLDRLTRFE